MALQFEVQTVHAFSDTDRNVLGTVKSVLPYERCLWMREECSVEIG